MERVRRRKRRMRRKVERHKDGGKGMNGSTLKRAVCPWTLRMFKNDTFSSSINLRSSSSLSPKAPSRFSPKSSSSLFIPCFQASRIISIAFTRPCRAATWSTYKNESMGVKKESERETTEEKKGWVTEEELGRGREGIERRKERTERPCKSTFINSLLPHFSPIRLSRSCLTPLLFSLSIALSLNSLINQERAFNLAGEEAVWANQWRGVLLMRTEWRSKEVTSERKWAYHIWLSTELIGLHPSNVLLAFLGKSGKEWRWKQVRKRIKKRKRRIERKGYIRSRTRAY